MSYCHEIYFPSETEARFKMSSTTKGKDQKDHSLILFVNFDEKLIYKYTKSILNSNSPVYLNTLHLTLNSQCEK